MTLSEEFKQALNESSITQLEMSWTLGVTQERLTALLSGASYQPHEELVMLRFIFKERNRKDLSLVNTLENSSSKIV